MQIISIQPAAFTDNIWVGKSGDIVEGKKLPYPFHVLPDGEVDNQEFWQGDPARVVGFQSDRDVQRVDLWWADAAKDPDSIVGKYPVMVANPGGIYTYTLPIEHATVREVSGR